MRILVTGACGWTAIAIIQILKEAGHQVFGFDIPQAQCPKASETLLDDIFRGDIANFQSINQATHSIEAIIHLAVAIGENDYQSADIPFAVNVKGTYNLFEAARRHKVKRTIVMSSAPIHLKHPKNSQVNALSDWKSSQNGDHLYDLTKRLQEEIAQDFCETYTMNAIVLRAGHIVDGQTALDPVGNPLATLNYCRGGWVCRYDLAKACLKALTIESKGYNAFHIIGSIEAEAYFDIQRTENELGLILETRFEQYH